MLRQLVRCGTVHASPQRATSLLFKRTALTAIPVSKNATARQPAARSAKQSATPKKPSHTLQHPPPSSSSPPPPAPPPIKQGQQAHESVAAPDAAAAATQEYSEPASYAGIAQGAFPESAAQILQEAIDPSDVEIKPDGTIYLPEIKYRRRLNRAFGPGAWAMKPIAKVEVDQSVLSRSYQMFCLGQFVAEATGEQMLRQGMTRVTAEESAKSNALMRCCKDLGIASELWDPTFINQWRSEHAAEVWAVNTRTGEKRRLWRKTNASLTYPWREERS